MVPMANAAQSCSDAKQVTMFSANAAVTSVAVSMLLAVLNVAPRIFALRTAHD
jgi:hypothetical protein